MCFRGYRGYALVPMRSESIGGASAGTQTTFTQPEDPRGSAGRFILFRGSSEGPEFQISLHFSK